jgi:hypothetical protein
MNKVITQIMPIYGKIFVGNRDYLLLEPEPVKYGSTVWSHNGVLKFYVMNSRGYACHLLVRGDFFIDTYYDLEQEVHFTVEEDDTLSNEKVIESLNEETIPSDRLLKLEQDEELPF